MTTRLILTTLLMVTFSMNCISRPEERIFYSSFSPQDWDVYISRDAGKSFEQFTDHPSLDYDAVISPDGMWVVFTSERSGIPQLYVKAIDGDSDPRLLVVSDSFQDQAAFSPDGRQLAFVASHEGNAEIYLMPFIPDTTQDISAARNLTNHPGGDFRPSFSPDGTKIAFSSDRGHPIVPHPRFSFARQRTGDIYVTDTEGERLERLTDSESWDGSPVWTADGLKIIFYSARHGQNSIFEMNTDGTDQQQIVDFSGPAVSPVLLPDGSMAFTTWNSEQDFKIMRVDAASMEITPLVLGGPDVMFNLNAHPGGLMVFHGGEYAQNHGVPGNFGFDGDLLAKLPDTLTMADKPVRIYGVRRAFVAPPQSGNTLLYYDASDIQSLFEFMKPLGFSVFMLPVLVVVLFLTGIILGIKNRKIVPFWKYLLFSVMVVILGLIVGGVFIFIDAINPLPLLQIRIIMTILALLTATAAWWFYKRRNRQQSDQNSAYRLSMLYSIHFWGLALFSFLCAVFINHFVYTPLHFYQVDYVSGEKREVFVFDKEPNTNPANFRVLDSKVTHDGKAFVFTTGSFRGSSHTPGDIWSYDFETGNVIKLSDSPYNDGFADLSDDGKMVFRSGRSGHFDIYLKEDDLITNLTNDSHRDNFPAISRQGDKIVFASDRLRSENEYKTMDIFLIRLRPDNSWSEPEKISVGEGQNAHAHFSPDGNWIVYTTEGYGINDEQPLIQPVIFSPQMYGEIVAYNVTTRERIRLTNNKWEDGAPLWVE
jgi:Tol biopolymer transport system component